MNCDYWQEIVDKLKILEECNWASRVLSTCIDEEGSNLEEALKCVSENEIIENAIYAYNNWDSYAYCREILLKFSAQKVTDIYKKIESPSELMTAGISDILEDFKELENES